MTIKTYRTRELKGFTLHLLIDGKRVHIAFRRGCTIGSTATYTTSDPKIQAELESLNDFGPTFYLESEKVMGEKAPEKVEKKVAPKVVAEPVIEEEEKEVVDILDAQTFKNIVELRNALIAKGVDASQVTNVKAAENLAKKNGYNYTVEKNA